MTGPPPDRVRYLRALRRGVWAATRPVIRDARGKTVPLFDSRVRLWRDPVGLDFPQADFHRVLERVHESMPIRVGVPKLSASQREARTLMAGVIVLGFIGVGFCVLLMNARGPGRTIGLVSFGVMLASAVPGIVYAWRRRGRVFPEGAGEVPIARAMLAEHRCPSCAYSIERVEPDVDGCVVCPECGAAWRGDRIRAVFSMTSA